MNTKWDKEILMVKWEETLFVLNVKERDILLGNAEVVTIQIEDLTIMSMTEILIAMPMIDSIIEGTLREDVTLMSTRVQGTIVGHMDLTKEEMEKQNIVGESKFLMVYL